MYVIEDLETSPNETSLKNIKIELPKENKHRKVHIPVASLMSTLSLIHLLLTLDFPQNTSEFDYDNTN